MAEKTLREFSPPSTENIHVGPTFDLGEYDYEIKPKLIKMVQVIIFSGKKDEDVCWYPLSYNYKHHFNK